MSSTNDKIIGLLISLSDGQRRRLLKCLKREESLVVCLGLMSFRIVEELDGIDDIISGKAAELCILICENPRFAEIIESLVHRIKTPDDLIGEFVDFRMENWPEE